MLIKLRISICKMIKFLCVFIILLLSTDGASVLRPESESTAVNTTIEEDTPLRQKVLICKKIFQVLRSDFMLQPVHFNAKFNWKEFKR